MSITIHHLEGPLSDTNKGPTTQVFGDEFTHIAFGREGDCDVVCPPECDTVGKHHLELIRTRFGDYQLVRFGNHYIEINGARIPHDQNNIPVASGSVIRIGGREGPAFLVQVKKPNRAQAAKTRTYEVVTGIPGQLVKNRRHIALGLASLAALALLVGYLYVERYLEPGEEQFPVATIERLKNAVYLVVQKEESGVEKPIATAFAFAPAKLGTNAHVIEAIRKAPIGTIILRGHEGEGSDRHPVDIAIRGYKQHPGYREFPAYLLEQDPDELDIKTAYQQLELPSAYDVGIIYVDQGRLPETLDIALSDELLKLSEAVPVAYAGFPSENRQGWEMSVSDPVPWVDRGNISGLANIFTAAADSPEHKLLITHNLRVTGGASGSPIIDANGKVIAIVSGGDVVDVSNPLRSLDDKRRAPTGFNFSQSIRLLSDLDTKSATRAVANDKAYWERRPRRRDPFALTLTQFFHDAKEHYKVEDGQQVQLGTDNEVLEPRDGVAGRSRVAKTYDFQAKPGWVYGFIAKVEAGDPLIVAIKQNGTYVTDPGAPPQQASRAWVSPMSEETALQIEVSNLIKKPLRYELHAYRWKLPSSLPAATAGPVAVTLSPSLAQPIARKAQ